MSRQISLHKIFLGLCMLILSVCFAELGFASENQKDKPNSLFETAYNLNEVDQSPKCIQRDISPIYPCNAKVKRIEGYVTLRCVIDKNGDVQEAEIAEAKPEGVFEKQALDVVKNLKFNPAMKDGKPVDCIVKLPIRFNLE